jgi:hypothetical protein
VAWNEIIETNKIFPSVFGGILHVCLYVNVMGGKDHIIFTFDDSFITREF